VRHNRGHTPTVEKGTVHYGPMENDYVPVCTASGGNITVEFVFSKGHEEFA